MSELFIVKLGGAYFEGFEVKPHLNSMQCAVFGFEKEKANPITNEEVEILRTYYVPYNEQYQVIPFTN